MMKLNSMPDYAEMYKTLFRSQNKVIEILQQAQQETEELYISDEGPALLLLQPEDAENKPDENDIPPSSGK